MSIVKEFNNFNELIKSIDESITATRQQLAEFLRRLEDIKVKSEQDRKLKELLKRLTGEEIAAAGKVVDLKDVKLFINPDSMQEAKILEEIVDKLNRSLQVLQSVRKLLEPLMGLEIEAKITVLYSEGVPTSILIKFVG
ncbi:MAG: hypothetical protein QXT88_00380 [Desulfurococcaceae archaeon]|uniref:Uncharacterized protein n=2 Tax=Staphylothermus marinus TaxID=2280 RepID=A0A7C4JLL1_STAMA